MYVHIKLKEILTERGLTQKWLVEQTGLRAAAISEMVNNQRTSVNKDHIIKVCNALGIDRLEDFMEFHKEV